eukprot:115287-Alexandrium_andersonii.AAC.1
MSASLVGSEMCIRDSCVRCDRPALACVCCCDPAPAGVDGATYAAATAAAPIRGLPSQSSGGIACFSPAEAPE